MTINELATRAEVTVRTIRYYVEQGVLPPPETGYPAEYSEEHLKRLLLIRRLKEQYLPLDEIRTIMQGVSPAEIEEILVEQVPPAQNRSPGLLNSATDYIATVMNWGNTREQLKQQAMTPPPAPASRPGTVPGPPGAGGGPGGAPPPGSYIGRGAPAPAPVAPPAQAAPAQSETTRSGEAPAKRREARRDSADHESGAMLHAPAANTSGTSTWQRLTLTPGVELHYLTTGEARIKHVVDRLLEAAGPILEAFPEKAVEESEC